MKLKLASPPLSPYLPPPLQLLPAPAALYPSQLFSPVLQMVQRVLALSGETGAGQTHCGRPRADLLILFLEPLLQVLDLPLQTHHLLL